MDVTMHSASRARRTNATARALGREETGKFGFLLDQMRVAHQSIDGIDSFVGPTTELTQGLDAYADEPERDMSKETGVFAKQIVDNASDRDGHSKDSRRESSETLSRSSRVCKFSELNSSLFNIFSRIFTF